MEPPRLTERQLMQLALQASLREAEAGRGGGAAKEGTAEDGVAKEAGEQRACASVAGAPARRLRRPWQYTPIAGGHMAASKGGEAKKGARGARKAAPEPGARAGKSAGTNKGAAAAGGAVKPDAARARAWRLRGGEGVSFIKSRKHWQVHIHYGEQLYLGCFKTEEDAIACRLLGEDRIAAGCHPKTGKYVPEAERPKPPKTQLKNNAHLLGKPAQKFSDAALGEHATDFADKVDAGTLDIDQVAGVHLHKKKGKWRAKMSHTKKQCQLSSHTSDLAEAIRYRLLAEKAIALFPDKNPQDYVTARMAAAGGAAAASKKRKRSTTVHKEEEEGAGAEETAPPLRRRRTRSTNEAPAKTPPTTDADADATKGAAVAGGAAKLDAARVRAWRLRGGIGVRWDEARKRWKVQIWYGKDLHLGSFKTKEEAIACRLLAEDRIDAGCHPKTGKYVPEAERPKPKSVTNTHLLGKPAATFSDAALGEHATDFAAKVDTNTLDINHLIGVGLHKATGKWRAQMGYKKKQCQLGSQTSDLAEAIRRRLLAEKAKVLFPDKNPQDYVAARMAAAGGTAAAAKKRKRTTTVNEKEEEGASAEETAPPLRRRRTRSTNEAPAKMPPTADADAAAGGGGDDDHDAYAAGDDDEADTDTDADADELRHQLAGQRKVVLALREALGRSGREAATHRRESEAHRREAEAHRREADAHRLEVEAQRRQTERLRREVARLQAQDGQCARSRPYYWQR